MQDGLQSRFRALMETSQGRNEASEVGGRYRRVNSVLGLDGVKSKEEVR